ncbi:glutaminase A [uncultured Pseudokineococcus sp.]|uniref:glutaminase A n=1 Tax=uncultured Pseudokineococcus sp. TaxID=1642928 RepID=UPI00260BD43D|nr:glutaminase A [uncultured Pseudokineococcus sp.]
MTSDGLVTAHLRHVLEDSLADTSGERATDVPQLADADPDLFGIALATLDGHVHAVGDVDVRATLQSLSKPFAYALAVADLGVDEVRRHVDVEPSGEPFDAISISPTTDRPRNPMINAGALAATSLVRGADPDERAERVRALCSGLAGRELDVDEDAAAAELESGQRNRAIAHLLLAHGRLGVDDPEDAVRAYVRQCALLVDVRDLAVMAATLAGGGVNPLTGRRVLETWVVRHVLSVMLTCGMYDAAGDWVATVGLPAKSGISGGLMAAVPAELGVAAWSPRLDPHGRSVRGLAAVRRLSAEMDLHTLHVHRGGRPPVRSSTTLADSPSSRERGPEDAARLARDGHRSLVLALHGDVLFAAAERVVRAVEESQEGLEAVVVDLRAVDEVVPAAARLLRALPRALPGGGRRVFVVDPAGLLDGALSTQGSRDDGAGGDDDGGPVVVGDVDEALAAAEDRVLGRADAPRAQGDAEVDGGAPRP